MLIKRSLAVVLLIGSAYTASAERIEFVAQQQGERVSGAEVCFFRAGDETSPFEYSLSSPEVRCLPADDVLQIPAGRWLYYTRHMERALVSFSSGRITKQPVPSNHLFRKSGENLVPAGYVDLRDVRATLGPDDSLVLYVSNKGTELLPMLVPVPAGESQALVPADVPAVLLRTRYTRVVEASEPFTVSAQKKHVGAFPASRKGVGSVLAWVEFPEEVRKPGNHWQKLSAPEVVLTSGEITVAPSIESRPGPGNDGALFLFKGVPPGPWKITLEGTVWSSAQINGEMPRNVQLVVADRAIVTRPAAAATLRWDAGRPAGKPDDDCQQARVEQGSPPRNLVLLLACQGLQPGLDPDLADARTCDKAVEPRELDMAAPTARFSGVNPGTYLVVLNEPGFAPRKDIVTLNAGDDLDHTLRTESFELFGRVLMNGEPLRARLEFRTGATASDESGQYYATLAMPPRDLPVVVRACDGRLLHTSLPTAPLQPNQPYDIDIRTNSVTVEVLDAESGQPLEDAAVQVGVVLAKDSGTFIGEHGATDEAGRIRIENVPNDRNLVICAVAERYARACADRFQMKGERQHAMTVRLAPIPFASRFVLPREIRWGFAYFVAPTGQVTEKARVEPDGRFSYRGQHRAPEHLVLTSDLPLLVVPLSSEFAPDTDIPWPSSAPLRSITVAIASAVDQEDALVGLFVGELYVPRETFIHHQGSRGFQADIYGRGPLPIRDVLETGPISVALGPAPTRMPLDIPPGTDVWAMPLYAGNLPRKTVGADSRVVFQ